MKLLLRVFIVLITVLVGLYFGGKYGTYLLENDIVDLGAPAGNLLYPLFWLVISALGGLVSFVIVGLVFIILKMSRRRKMKNMQENLN